MKNPNYKSIYMDIINEKCPERINDFKTLLQKDNLSVLDIIYLNDKIFKSNKESRKFNQQRRAYNKEAIFKILEYQKRHHLNNTQISIKFNLSRNSIAKWKKIYIL